MNQQVSHHHSQPVIITGMHRSGTSLTASIMQQAGVFVGDLLLPANTSNQQGYFEDIDFLVLHENILKSQGISNEGWLLTEPTEVPRPLYDQAINLCDSRLKNHALWGWKEPRTTLFLKFWKQLLPQAKFIFTYRSPWEVMDSLFTWGHAAFANNPNFAVQIWIAYNQMILRFYEQHPDDCFLFHCDLLKTDEAGFVEKVKHKFDIPLTIPAKPLFQPGDMHNQVNNTQRPALLAVHFPAVIEVYQQLQQAADVPTPQPLDHVVAADTAAVYQDWVLQDWYNSNRFSTELKKTQAELQAAQTAATHWRLTVEAMEANRVWKLRNFWLGLKKQLRLMPQDEFLDQRDRPSEDTTP